MNDTNKSTSLVTKNDYQKNLGNNISPLFSGCSRVIVAVHSVNSQFQNSVGNNVLL